MPLLRSEGGVGPEWEGARGNSSVCCELDRWLGDIISPHFFICKTKVLRSFFQSRPQLHPQPGQEMGLSKGNQIPPKLGSSARICLLNKGT